MFESKLYRTTTSNRRKLEKISNQNHLNSSKGFRRKPSRLKETIEWVKKTTRKHGYLIDNENLCFGKSLCYIFSRDNHIDIILRKNIAYPHSTPRVNRHPSYMRRCDTSRSGYRNHNRMFSCMSDKPIDEKCFSRSGSSSQKNIVPHREYVESFVLCHRGSIERVKKNTKISYETDILLFYCNMLHFHNEYTGYPTHIWKHPSKTR